MAKRNFNPIYICRFVRDAPFAPGRRGENLPEGYRKFWREWKIQQKEPVHYIPEPGKWKLDPVTGEVKRIQNVPLPLKFPEESQKQLWGGEGVVQGFQKRRETRRRVPHFWMPKLKKSVVYSEILNKYMSVVMTERVVDLIHKHFGFDHYILKTPACDLQSDVALKLKRKLLTTLYNKDLSYEDPDKNESVYDTYKQYLSNYSKEDIEWYGLTLEEALLKLQNEKEEMEESMIGPLKHQFRMDLINELLQKDVEKVDEPPELKTTWLSKLNPFQSKRA